jgi:hypothetical protein
LIASDSPSSNYSAVFEDDGDTAYLYAYDRSSTANRILDGVHIYDASDARDAETEISIIWSPDGLKAGLLMNEELVAVLNFEAKKAYCRSNPASPNRNRLFAQEAWSNSLHELFDHGS